MAKQFNPEDFEPIYHQTIVITIAIQENPGCTLSMLSPFLDDIHTKLSSLIFKASNPNSLLRRRCSDRHPDWLQIQYDLQNTLCEAQDLVDSLSKSDVLEIGDQAGSGPEKVEEELAVHSFNLGEFISSLGLSKLARKEPVLAEIERILIDAVRDEREKLGKAKVADVPDVARLGGLNQIMRLLRANGVDQSELNRLDTKIKQDIIWVLRNEEEITMVKDLEGFGDLGKNHFVDQPPQIQTQQEEHNEGQEEEFSELVQVAEPSGQPASLHEESSEKGDDKEQHDADDADDDYDTVSIDSYVLI
jgi:hypothetical protein